MFFVPVDLLPYCANKSGVYTLLHSSNPEMLCPRWKRRGFVDSSLSQAFFAPRVHISSNPWQGNQLAFAACGSAAAALLSRRRAPSRAPPSSRPSPQSLSLPLRPSLPKWDWDTRPGRAFHLPPTKCNIDKESNPRVASHSGANRTMITNIKEMKI